MLERLFDPAVVWVLIPLAVIAALVGSRLARAWMRHRERMAMIEQGMHPDARHDADEPDERYEAESPALGEGDLEELDGPRATGERVRLPRER